MIRNKLIEGGLILAMIGCLVAGGFLYWQDVKNHDPEGLAFDVKGDGSIDLGELPPGKHLVKVTLQNRTPRDRRILGVNRY